MGQQGLMGQLLPQAPIFSFAPEDATHPCLLACVPISCFVLFSSRRLCYTSNCEQKKLGLCSSSSLSAKITGPGVARSSAQHTFTV